jgi:hypothetical protein
MAYEYIERMYGFKAEVGRRVRHSVTQRDGVIAREKPAVGHYVQVKFDGMAHALPCHPEELSYI